MTTTVSSETEPKDITTCPRYLLLLLTIGVAVMMSLGYVYDKPALKIWAQVLLFLLSAVASAMLSLGRRHPRWFTVLLSILSVPILLVALALYLMGPILELSALPFSIVVIVLAANTTTRVCAVVFMLPVGIAAFVHRITLCCCCCVPDDAEEEEDAGN